MVAAFPAGASQRTLVLSQGKNGYLGAADTSIETNDWASPPQHTLNYGQNEWLHLDRDGGASVLIRFDLSAIPANAVIVSATLELYNTTASGSAGRQLERRVEAFAVLRAWDEGNQVEGQVSTTPGAHGATGDNAFSFYPGEGTDVPWGARGMQAGVDFGATVLAAADVVDQGWCSWDLQEQVQGWVRGREANHGIVLRDATGWEDGNTDWRDFVSSQSPDTAHRPRLRLVYDPDTPVADAGGDLTELHWDGGPVILDGSASHDHPGGDDGSLRFSWRVSRAAFGSSAGGELCATAVCSFQPDAAGCWELELVATNAQGESASDTVRLRLARIPRGHPRIFLTPARLAVLRERAREDNPRWRALLGQASRSDGDKLAKALVRQLLDDPSYCRGADGAIALAMAEIAGQGRWSTQAGDIALVYDWCHGELASADRDAILGFFGSLGNDGDDLPGWGNYWPRWGYSYAMMGLATLDESPEAGAWMDEYRERRFATYDVPNLDRIAAGGGWPEGTVYDWIANLWRVKAVEGWRSATGENLFLATDWFRQRPGFLLMQSWPGVRDVWGSSWYHPYTSHGDAERNRGSMANYGRIMGEILIGAFPDEVMARQLQAYLAASPADHPDDFLAHEELLFFNPDQTTAPPGPTGWLAAGTGDVVFRSGWPSGAADTDPQVTVLGLHCGDRFSYHQHYEQGSFTLYSGEPVLLDSGVYSGDGLSNHDVNYYVRTIAHNTLVVFSPQEDFSASRPDATSNDGGQRSPYPGTRAPPSVAYRQEHGLIYETGDILRYENTGTLGYVLADATAAYNNPAYNQADRSDLPGNVAKVTRFQRELVYLRRAAPEEAEAVVLYDRVGVTDPSFSGGNTKLLFHVQNEPEVDGSGTEVSAGETLFPRAREAVVTAPGGARATLRFLLPADHNVRRVGGRGVKAFWAFDANYDWQWEENEPQPRPVNDFEDTPWGEWRLELEPADRDLDHSFLTVILPDPTGTAAVPSTKAIADDDVEGVLIGGPGPRRAVLFASSRDGSTLLDRFSYTLAGTGRVRHTVADVVPGSRWELAISPSETGQTVVLSPSTTGALAASAAGVLRFCTDGPRPCTAARAPRPVTRHLPR
ncbi:MAG: DNRLRE domain-containing protein [Acidobacteria bacterium]|nr:DNRLRE domain-containing protein [Acidobacteriota bacterium]